MLLVFGDFPETVDGEHDGERLSGGHVRSFIGLVDGEVVAVDEDIMRQEGIAEQAAAYG